LFVVNLAAMVYWYADSSDGETRAPVRPSTVPAVVLPSQEQDFEVRGAGFAAPSSSSSSFRGKVISRQPQQSRPEVVKVSVPLIPQRSGGSRSVVNSQRGTSSQAQALQRLRDAKLSSKSLTAVGTAKSSGSDVDVSSKKSGINYAALAKLESEQSSLS
jgi:hypothetical protein